MTVPRQSQRQRLDRAEAGRQRLGSEQGPATGHRGQVGVHHRPPAQVAGQARAFLGLQLEQFQHPHGLAGRGHHPQLAVGPGQHEPGGADLEQLDAAVSQQGQQFHHVEVRYQGVCQLHQRPGQY